MNSPSFADVATARGIAERLYPGVDIQMIEHSHDNIVALVADTCALRFPRDGNAYQRSRYEAHVLPMLGPKTTLTIPRILSQHSDPVYTVTSLVPGQHMSSSTIRGFSEAEQQAFAAAVAQFAYTMHSTFELDAELAWRQKLGLDTLDDNEPWPIYYRKVIQEKTYPKAIQDSLAKQQYAAWDRLCNIAPTVVVHDDLHTENMLFQDTQLVGILDFGDTSVGTPEQDLRQLYRISESIMLLAVQEYKRLSGRMLNVEAIKIWAIMKELADYSKAMAANNMAHHSFKRAARNLDVWLPAGEWSRGYDVSDTESYQ